MLTVSLLIEFLRTRPRLIFWMAVLTQAVLWIFVPSLFYSAPPGEVADVIAIGHGFTFGASHGPPLAYWFAEIRVPATGGLARHLYAVAALHDRRPIGPCSSSAARPSASATRRWPPC